jgi:predicted small secreted protein
MRQRNSIAVVICFTLAACSGSSGKGMTISATASPAARAAARTALEAGNGVTIDRLRIVVSRFEVEGTPACDTSGTSGPTGPTGPTGPMSDRGSTGSDDDSGKDDGECEIEAGPFLVELAGADLTAGVHAVAGIDLAAGTYEELRFKIGPVSVAPAGSSSGLAAMVADGASIEVEGTDGGVAFVFKTAMSVSQKREGSIVVDPTTGTNVTLDFDPSKWFQAADGTKLAPGSASSAAAIEANIRASIRLVHDDDRDGHDDESHD